ncbi:MAG: M3 family metallopeptidase, partial [Eubacteriales bacterium]|nr:M3 family metallopeptidase [Eubacteriales bacterium]
WHSIEKNYNGEIINFEREFLNKTDILPVIKESVMSTRFSHIFDGGYAAGYYSYLWAWVLEADAFTEFKENGIMSREIGEKFRSLILAKGASEDPLKIYVDFTGREPSLNPLAERNGWN